MLKVAKTNITEFVKGLDAAADRYNELIDNIDRLVEIAEYYDDTIKDYFDDAMNGYKLDSWNAEKIERIDRTFNERVTKITETRENASLSFADFDESWLDEDFFESLLEVETAKDDEDDEEFVYGEDFNELANNVYDLINELKVENSDYFEGSYNAVARHVKEVNPTVNNELELFKLIFEDELLRVEITDEFKNRIEYIKKLIK